MLSGNGRHRRPRQAPALVVAAGVTGSAIAIPLLGATGASAADGTTWDRVAQCESGGEWSADSGNGYYGGLQLTQEHWEKYGGLTYAPSADEASRQQQIAVAEKLLDDQGLAAWPTCGPLSGLSKNSGEVKVDTGMGDDSSDSSASSGSLDSSLDSSSPDSSSSDEPSSDPSSDATESTGKAGTSSGTSDSSGDSQDSGSPDTDTAKSDDSGNSEQNGDASSTSEGATTGAGRHRGGSADENATGNAVDGRTDDASGRHASRDSGASRDVTDGSYVVRAGDSLWTIADALDLKGGWSELYAANEKAVGADPNLILPGQSLAVGAEPGEK